ncbi:MAG: hypothetical protein ACE5HK_06060 [Candidatus Methylomirabilales bacterium]
MTMNNNRVSRGEIALRSVLLAALCVLAVSAAVVLGVRTAGAHGNPEVQIEPNPVAFGGEVTIEGEDFEEDTDVSLVLEGVLGEISLDTVTTDSEGMFSLTVTLPSTAAPGSYRIRAVGPEDVAVAALRIQEGEAGTALAAEHETAVDFHRIDSGAEVAGFAGLGAALILLGGVLLWLPRGERHA